MTIYMLVYLYRLGALHTVSSLAVRNGIIQAYTLNDLDPKGHITALLFAPQGGMKVKVDNVRMCPFSALPACPDSTIAQGEMFMVRVEGQNDFIMQYLGLSYVVWVPGINSNPVSMTPT